MKKIWIGVFVFVILAFFSGIYYWQVASKKTQMPEVSSGTTPTPAPEELLEWKDQAGFLFRYPKSLRSDIHQEDQENYAHIEFTHPDHIGTIVIWAKGTLASDAAVWVKKEKTLASGTVFDTTFADQAAKKVLLNIPKKKIITATVFEAIVFYVEGEFEDSDYWLQTYDTITSTFSFATGTPTASQSVSSEDGGDEITVDEEEILE